MRTRFFAYRSRIAHAALLLGLVGAGAALHAGEAVSRRVELAVFAFIFGLAGLFRLVSAGFLWRQSEPVPLPPGRKAVGPGEILRRARASADGRLLVYMLAVQAAVQISGPFFTPYMFKQIHLSYAQYLLLLATSFGAKMTALPLWGRLGHRHGAQFLLYTGGIGIVPLSALWLVSDSFTYLFFVQLVAGTLWAAYELGTFLLLFERIEVTERTSMLTIFNLANAVATVAGALAGAAILGLAGAGRHGYEALFAISCGVRLLSLVLLARLHPAAAQPGVQPEPAVSVRAMAARPNTGSLDAPIVAGLDDRGAAK
jgi:MFS family permease